MADSPPSTDDLKAAVREKYAALATEDESCCGSSGCCGTDADFDEIDDVCPTTIHRPNGQPENLGTPLRRASVEDIEDRPRT